MANDPNQTARIEPYALTINDAARFAGWTRSEVYRRLNTGDIYAVKNGKRTLVLMDSLRAYLQELPPATFRQPAEKSAA